MDTSLTSSAHMSHSEVVKTLSHSSQLYRHDRRFLTDQTQNLGSNYHGAGIAQLGRHSRRAILRNNSNHGDSVKHFGIKRVGVATLALSLTLSSCQSDLANATEDTATKAELESLRSAALAYQEAASAKNADAVVGMYDETALMIPPNAEIVDEGLEGVEGYQFGFIVTPGVSLDFELIRVEVAESGDIGWTFAIGDITIQREGEEPGRDIVRDFHTWKKQADGSWKIVVDMWNSGMPSG